MRRNEMMCVNNNIHNEPRLPRAYSKQLWARYPRVGTVSGTRSTLEWIKNKSPKPCRKIQPSESSQGAGQLRGAARPSLALTVRTFTPETRPRPAPSHTRVARPIGELRLRNGMLAQVHGRQCSEWCSHLSAQCLGAPPESQLPRPCKPCLSLPVCVRVCECARAPPQDLSVLVCSLQGPACVQVTGTGHVCTRLPVNAGTPQGRS